MSLPNDDNNFGRENRDSLALIRKDMTLLSSSVTKALEAVAQNRDMINRNDIRITAIEEARRQRALDEVRSEERDKARTDAMNVRFTNIETQLTDIKGNTSKVVWIIITAIAVALVTFVIKGGLILP